MASAALRVFLLLISLCAAGKIRALSNKPGFHALVTSAPLSAPRSASGVGLTGPEPVTVCSLPAGGFEYYSVDRCTFNSSELKDIEYSRSLYYNKHMFVQFSSSVEKFVGFTKFGLYQADYFNNLTSYLEQMRHEKQRYCYRNVQNKYSNILSKSGTSVAPSHL